MEVGASQWEQNSSFKLRDLPYKNLCKVTDPVWSLAVGWGSREALRWLSRDRCLLPSLGDLSLIPGTHTVQRKTQLIQAAL